MKEAKFVTLNWKKCSPARFVSGVKNGRTPQGAIRGGNGSFIVIDEPAELSLTVSCENEYTTTSNFIDSLRYYTGWERITENRVEKLRKYFSNETFHIDNTGYVTDLDSHLRNFAMCYA